ncbi:MAG: acyl-CoA-binding domain-containing protein [Thermaurantimonas sp.]|uniref:acyl-CoA-binding domain-containing protein n=1 Tax=Thermaurantimonas sp. TaxID=2681568 RepID=UPI00391DD833
MYLEEIALPSVAKISDADFQKVIKSVNFYELPLDIRILLEAYKNQAIIGDNPYPRPERYSMVMETLLHDAWARLKGMPKSVAQKEFIRLLKSVQH